MKKYKLDAEEQKIEDSLDHFRPVSKARKEELKTMAVSGNRSSITLRLQDHDLEKIKLFAEKEGMPYQTLISSVLHKYVNGTLVDESTIKKAISLLSRK